MDTHLIIAVHGIGEQQPGETVDEIVGAATTQIAKRDPLFLPVTVDRDVVELADERLSVKPRNGSFFPVHLRKVQKAKNAEKPERAIFAEVFWADKSPAPSGPFWTIFDLLKIVLGLGYLAMENAESNRGKLSIWLVHLFTWIFYGFVAPMNAMLLIGSVLLLLDLTPLWTEFSPDHLPWIIAGHGLCTLLIGLYVRLVLSKTYLVRIFGNGLSVVGVAVLLMLGLSFASSGVNTYFCDVKGGQVTTLTHDIDCYAGFVLLALGTSWVMNVAVALLIGLVGLIGAFAGASRHDFPMQDGETHTINDNVPGLRAIFPSICAAMVLFWSVIASSLWLLLLNISSQLSSQVVHETPAVAEDKDDADGIDEMAEAGGEGVTSGAPPLPDETLADHIHSVKSDSLLFTTLDGNIRSVLQTMSITTAIFITLILVAGILVGIRKAWPDKLYEKAEWRSRLILNPVLHYFLMVSLGLVAFALASMPDLNARMSCDPATDRIFSLCWFHAQNAKVTALLLALGVIIYRLSNHISGGLGIFRDIVTYSVQESCAWKSNRAERAKNFTQRNQINARFRRTLHYGLEAFEPTRVTIIAHSLGSIIAVKMLQDKDVKALLKKNGDPEVVLITMGSPATHIYRRYFKEFFQVSTVDMPLCERPHDPVRKAWYNIHREDDFVGTRIGDDLEHDAPDLATNYAVEAGGHTGYFTDYHVWKVLRDQIGFRLFPSQFNPAAFYAGLPALPSEADAARATSA